MKGGRQANSPFNNSAGDYRLRRGQLELLETWATIVVWCVRCGRAVKRIRTREMDRGARLAKAAARHHRMVRPGHAEFRFLNGKVEQKYGRKPRPAAGPSPSVAVTDIERDADAEASDD